MSNGELLTIEPMNLQFPFELKKQISCSLYLTNKTDNNVAFKVKTTNPENYCVRPNYGLILPKSTCKVLVTMQAQKEAPTDMQSSDKFMIIQSVIASPGVTAKEVTRKMFSNEPGNLVRETKLRVTYVCFNITNSSSNGELLTIEPMNLQFPFELKKQTSCSLYLTNNTDNNVAFKVKTTNPKKYSVRPNYGLILPKSTCKVLGPSSDLFLVTMQAQKEAPTDIQSNDKFMIQSVIASPGITAKEVTRNMFSNESGNLVRETKLRVSYVCLFNITDSSSIERRFFTKVFCCI